MGVELVGKCFALDKAKLAQVVTVVGCEENVGVVKLASGGEPLHNPLNPIVHRLESLESLGHQSISEPLVDGQHALGVSQDPLLVGVGGQVIGGRVVGRGPVEHVLVLGGVACGQFLFPLFIFPS